MALGDSLSLWEKGTPTPLMQVITVTIHVTTAVWALWQWCPHSGGPRFLSSSRVLFCEGHSEEAQYPAWSPMMGHNIDYGGFSVPNSELAETFQTQ